MLISISLIYLLKAKPFVGLANRLAKLRR